METFWILVLLGIILGDFGELLVTCLVVWGACGIVGEEFSWELALGIYLIMCIVHLIYGRRKD